jgi:hypothetical protein
MSTSLRLPFDRRSRGDRRIDYDPGYFSRGGTWRRSFEDRRVRDERWRNWIRVSEWSSVWRELFEPERYAQVIRASAATGQFRRVLSVLS